VGGGITFDTFVSGGGPVTDGTIFEIFPDEETARNSVFNASEVEPLKVSVIFDDNIAGLVVGAPIELSGLNIGKVDTLSGIVDFDQFGDSRVRLNVIMSIQPWAAGGCHRRQCTQLFARPRFKRPARAPCLRQLANGRAEN
jgi:paraquat-inducible protein B